MKVKKLLSAAVAVVAVGSLALTGCSTPKTAISVGDKDYSTGEYLAYMYNAYSRMAQYYAYSGYSGDQLWSQTLPYGEGDDQVNLEFAEYLKKTAQDAIIREAALETLMKKYDVSISEDDLKQMDSDLSSLKTDQFIAYGFNNEHFKSMYKAVNYNETTLFNALYDVGGKEGMTEKEMREYFDKNYLSYKSIEISLTDSDGKDRDDAAKKKVKSRLESYLSQYNKSKDFDAVIEKYNADEAASTSSSGATTTTTTAATTTTTAATTAATTQAADSTTATTASTTAAETTTTTDPNLNNIEGADSYSDEDFLKALQGVKEGEAKIVEYKKNGTTNTMALVLRLNPEKANGKDYFENSHSGILHNAKDKAFDEMVDKTIDGLKVNVNDRAIKMCDPKELFS